MSPGSAALLGLGGGSMLGAIISVCVTRYLLRRSGGTMPPPPPLRPGEARALLSPGHVELPPGVEDRFPADFIERLNQPRRK